MPQVILRKIPQMEAELTIGIQIYSGPGYLLQILISTDCSDQTRLVHPGLLFSLGLLVQRHGGFWEFLARARRTEELSSKSNDALKA